MMSGHSVLDFPVVVAGLDSYYAVDGVGRTRSRQTATKWSRGNKGADGQWASVAYFDAEFDQWVTLADVRDRDEKEMNSL